MIVLRSAPYLVCVMGIVNLPARILLFDSLLNGLAIIPVPIKYPLIPAGGVSADKYMESVKTLMENMIRTTSNNIPLAKMK